MPEPIRRKQQHRWARRGLPVTLVVALVVAGTAVTRSVASADPGDSLRTGTVVRADVQQTLNLAGTAQRVNQQSASFAVNGSVAHLRVAVGDQVRTGQVLATLDRTPLERAVTEAEATLARARATLESDQSAQTSATTSATTSAAPSSSTALAGVVVVPAVSILPAAPSAPATTTRSAPATRTPGPGASGTTPSGTPVQRAQQAAAAAAKTAAADLDAVSALLSAQEKACTGALSAPPPTPTPTPTTTPTPTATPGAPRPPRRPPARAHPRPRRPRPPRRRRPSTALPAPARRCG